LFFGLSVSPDGYNVGDQFTYSGGTNPSPFNGTYTVAEVGFIPGIWIIVVNTDSTESATSEGGFIIKVN
jgi:hypothetical protein